ncbi:CRACD-like protein isoform X2 [Choloepus didactylus]|uniref:CRACD-like protein isoform X2 n=1 Tax=Choloepus didactylus TaxID=27675 RepID=UPI00189FB49D|nr:CRACD-like protein isoform X2 [Choloepus didactylus]
MISTRVMDVKLREAAEGLGEDSAGKKKSKFKTFKKFFGKKKRKEVPSSTGSSTWKQSPVKREVIAIESGPVGYDSEDELEESRAVLGSRALSHDSIFIPESGQDPARPVRVFSQENVCDRIKALQLKIQCHVKMGPPPPTGGLPAKRGEDTGVSSEDDGLPGSPPEMSLLHDTGLGTIIKVSFVSSSRPPSPEQPPSRQPPSPSDSSGAPPADFSQPPESSSCLDNSAAKHKLLVKPRNQRSSKMRRLSSRAQSESLSDLTCAPEEEEEEEGEKVIPKVSAEESPSPGQQDLVLDRGSEPGAPATPLQPGGTHARGPELDTPTALPQPGGTHVRGPEPDTPAMPQPGGTHARRARLQHCPALSASTEEGPALGDDPCSCQATPEDTEPGSEPAPCSEPPSLPEGPPQSKADSGHQEQDTVDGAVCAPGDTESRFSACIPEGHTAPPDTVTTATLEMPSSPDRPDLDAQKEAKLTLEVSSPEGAERESSVSPAPSPQAPKSCLKHKAPSASASLSPSPTPLAPESPQGEPTPCSLDREAAPAEAPKAGQVSSPRGGPERKLESGGSELRSMKKFSVSSCRLRPHAGSVCLPERTGPAGPSAIRLPLLRSGLAWRSEAELDDLQGPSGPRNGKLDPEERDAQGSGDTAVSQAALGGGPRKAATSPAARDPCPATQGPATFPVKLRSTSLSFKYRASSSPEQKGVKRYSAEIRLEKGGLTLLSKDDRCQVGAAPGVRGARSPNDPGKVRARPSEQPSSKPPLPRKPLLQALTLPQPPAPPHASPSEPEKAVVPADSRKESKMVEKKSVPRVAEKGPSPAATGPRATGQPTPPWVTIARQRRRGAPDQPPTQEDRPGVRTPKSEAGKQTKAPERSQEPVKQADFVRSKSFLIAPAKPAAERKQENKLNLKEGLQRGISLSHQNLDQSAAMMEKELNQLKRASYASVDQPSWMELARKKSQAWSDMPQIIK